MNFDSFFKNAKTSNLTLDISKARTQKTHLLNNEALFQLPLISLIILLMAKDRRKPFVSQIAQLVGECIEHSIYGFKGSPQHIGWSANLRVRTVKALSFLEVSSLIAINNRKGRIKITPLGKKIIEHALNNDDDLSYNLVLIARSYRHICVSKQFEMELE